MQLSDEIESWFGVFPALRELGPRDLALARGALRFPTLAPGDVAYRQGWPCPNYVMCIDGLTRVFKMSSSGREMLVYRVSGGGSCVLTTQCLLSGGVFPAESVAEAPTRLAVIPAETFHRLMAQSDVFRRFVLDDYGRLLSSLFQLLDEVAFATLDQRLARLLVAQADGNGEVGATHQQLAHDLGSVREVVTRQLGEWERAGLVKTGRGSILIVDRAALASWSSQ